MTDIIFKTTIWRKERFYRSTEAGFLDRHFDVLRAKRLDNDPTKKVFCKQ
jgi:hypothetical protein